MYSSFSTDGVNFTKDDGTVLKPRSSAHYVEDPTVFQLPNKSWRMYFNENTVAAGNNRDGEIWGASSSDGLTWTKIRDVGIHGADVDGYFQKDGTIRVYYGDFDPATGGKVYMGVLKTQ